MADADALYFAHERAVFRYLCRIVGRPEAARDLTQEVFLRVQRASATRPAADAASLRGWVFAIARNLALTHRRDVRFREIPVAATQAAPAIQELVVALDQALGRLDDLDREVFMLREADGLTYQEVADACALSVEAVRARLRRTRENCVPRSMVRFARTGAP